MRNPFQAEHHRLGSELKPDDKAYVLAAYVHRFTGDHKPEWACKLRPDGTAYPLQFADDADWLAHTSFAVRANGDLDKRYGSCVSIPTWPNNPELRIR